MIYGIVAAAMAVLLGIVAAFMVLKRASRAGLVLHQQLDVVQREVMALRTSTDVGVMRQEMTAMRVSLETSREDHNLWAGRLQKELADVRNHVQDGLRESSLRLEELKPIVEDVSQAIVRKPLQALSIDLGGLDSANETELIQKAEALSFLRPLAPYPRWRTDADLNNPDMAYQLRRWLWQYFHDRQSEPAVVVPWHAGTRLRLFLGNDESAQIYIAGCTEPNEFALLDRLLRPGMTFLDAGANDGIYTVFAAKRVGPQGSVWAFEPSRRELERLQFNLELNGLSARVFPLALAELNGDAEHQGQNTLGAFAYQGVAVERKESVKLRRLDDLVEEDAPERIDVMKLDIEGAELRLLKGAVGTIERYRPYILFEASEPSLRNQGASREELVGFLRAQRYRMYRFDSVSGLPVPANPGLYSDNMVAAPEENPLPDAARSPWPVCV